MSHNLPQSTYHWSLRISRHMAPVTELMLGCQILVVNFTCKNSKQSRKYNNNNNDDDDDDDIN